MMKYKNTIIKMTAVAVVAGFWGVVGMGVGALIVYFFIPPRGDFFTWLVERWLYIYWLNWLLTLLVGGMIYLAINYFVVKDSGK